MLQAGGRHKEGGCTARKRSKGAHFGRQVHHFAGDDKQLNAIKEGGCMVGSDQKVPVLDARYTVLELFIF